MCSIEGTTDIPVRRPACLLVLAHLARTSATYREISSKGQGNPGCGAMIAKVLFVAKIINRIGVRCIRGKKNFTRNFGRIWYIADNSGRQGASHGSRNQRAFGYAAQAASLRLAFHAGQGAD
jgi:hypothetical protein